MGERRVMSENLEKEVKSLKDQLKAVSAQCDAAKQMFNESAASILALKTTIIQFQQAYQEQVNKIKELNDLLVARDARIIQLENDVAALHAAQPVAAEPNPPEELHAVNE